MAQGVQQAFEISVIGVEEFENANISLKIYPNPTSDFLLLELNDGKLSNLTFQLIDMQGRLLTSGKITGDQTNISMQNLKVATYFVKITQENKTLKTFKVIKN